MLDVSRNGVARTDELRRVLLRLSLMGVNKFCLYTEDTYEVEGHPLIGYGRGRYSKAELRALDRYAAALGIEMFPCIQTLGHMEHILKYGRYGKMADNDRVISAVHPETRAFVETLIREASEPYKSRLVHVGMDETHGLGLGKAFKPGVVNDPRRLYLQHTAFVAATCRRLGLEPMMWGDIIEGRHALPLTAKQRRAFPSNMRVVFWDYYTEKAEPYRDRVRQYRKMGKEPVCSPGIWNWNCLWPVNGRVRVTLPLFLLAAKKEGVRDMLLTAWGDDGQECPLNANWPALAMFAEGTYVGSLKGVAARMKAVTGLDHDTLVALGALESLPGRAQTKGAPGKALLWEDPMSGRISHHLGRKRLAGYYRDIVKLASAYVRSVPPEFRPLMDYARALASVLELKADIFNEARAAYTAGDRDGLLSVSRKIGQLIERVERLRLARQRVWFGEFKPFGWEVLDNRFGGLRSRLETMKARIDEFLRGGIASIEELAAKPVREFDSIGDLFVWHGRLSSLSNAR
jgi:hypothetical protein